MLLIRFELPAKRSLQSVMPGPDKNPMMIADCQMERELVLIGWTRMVDTMKLWEAR